MNKIIEQFEAAQMGRELPPFAAGDHLHRLLTHTHASNRRSVLSLGQRRLRLAHDRLRSQA